MIERIPLFPLNLVLFPGAELPLHIFEPRYREMIGDCLAKNLDFGMVCAFPEAKGRRTARVGCSARIQGVLSRYEDGRLDILVVGVRRFRIQRVVENKSYREADVEWLEEKIDFNGAVAERERVIDLHQQLLLLAFEEGSAVNLRLPEDPAHIAFTLTRILPFELAVKQAVLEGASEKLRLGLLARGYEALLERARAIVDQVEDPPKHIM